MWIGICLCILLIVIYVIYKTYFSNYFETQKVFNLLEKTIDARNLLVLKLLPEVSEKNSNDILLLIQRFNKEKDSGYTAKIYIDIELNEHLKKFYDEVHKIQKNEVVERVFNNLIQLEKQLKNIRKEYNAQVEKYNSNLVKNKYMCMRVFKMKPLDTYRIR